MVLMDRVSRPLLALLVVFVLSTSTANAQPQVNRPQLARQVRAEFLHAWNGYKQYCWGHDDLKPISKTCRSLGSSMARKTAQREAPSIRAA